MVPRGTRDMPKMRRDGKAMSRPLWTREEAYAYLNDRYHMDKLSESAREKMISDLMSMGHRPWCRVQMAESMPNYGSDCTCDAKYCGQCWACLEAKGKSLMMMILCETCGNKRCPHANDCKNACTGSNEVGQPGSAYEEGTPNVRRIEGMFGE